MRLVPVPSLQVGDVIADDKDKSKQARILAITERPHFNKRERIIYFQLDMRNDLGHRVVERWRKSTDGPKAWLVNR